LNLSRRTRFDLAINELSYRSHRVIEPNGREQRWRLGKLQVAKARHFQPALCPSRHHYRPAPIGAAENAFARQRDPTHHLIAIGDMVDAQSSTGTSLA
jgi:hypothetical protein